MSTYATTEDYTADVIKARVAYEADEAVRAGFCSVLCGRKRDTNTRSRRCWACRHEGRREGAV